MTQPVIHKPLILTGCFIWITSFFGEGLGYQPYSTFGIVISPFLISIGIFYWFKFYKLTRGHYPKFWTTYKVITSKMYNNPFDGFVFMFKHILETWTLTIVFWILLSITIFIVFRQSDAFEVTKKYCEKDKEVLIKTGKIKYYGLLVSGSIATQGQSGEAKFSFIIIGEKGVLSAKSELTKSNDEWTVERVVLQ